MNMFFAHMLGIFLTRSLVTEGQRRVVLGKFFSEWLNVISRVLEGSRLVFFLFLIFTYDLMMCTSNLLGLKIINENNNKELQVYLKKLLKW
jgi:hypothetical protein